MTGDTPVVISIFGLGYVGLTTALGFADMGCRVYGFEINEKRKAQLQEGKVPFHEPGLQEAMNRHLNRRFFIEDHREKPLRESGFIFYCVATPGDNEGKADVTQMMNAFRQTADALAEENMLNPVVLVIKSTIPPGTTRDRLTPYLHALRLTPERGFFLAVNPEFLREGFSWEDFIHPDRVVIGTDQDEAAARMRELYRAFKAPVIAVNPTTAEYIKYLSNGLLATMISYANEQLMVADAIGDVEISSAFKALHMDKRWLKDSMKAYVYPGCGYGGACLPKDVQALAAQADQYGVATPLLRSVTGVNQGMPGFFMKQIQKMADPGDTIGLLGLAFKPGSDDVRNTPALPLITLLQRSGYQSIAAYDPLAMPSFQEQHPELSVTYMASMENLIQRSDLLVIVTAWAAFKDLPLRTTKPILDARFML